MANRGQIYTVGVKLTYDIYEPKHLWIKPQFLRKDSQIRWEKPIFANTQEKAIDKFKLRFDYEKCTVDPWLAGHGIFEQLEYHNVEHQVVIVRTTNNYTFDELKSQMNSQDFLEYCRQELIEVNEVIK